MGAGRERRLGMGMGVWVYRRWEVWYISCGEPEAPARVGLVGPTRRGDAGRVNILSVGRLRVGRKAWREGWRNKLSRRPHRTEQERPLTNRQRIRISSKDTLVTILAVPAGGAQILSVIDRDSAASSLAISKGHCRILARRALHLGLRRWRLDGGTGAKIGRAHV